MYSWIIQVRIWPELSSSLLSYMTAAFRNADQWFCKLAVGFIFNFVLKTFKELAVRPHVLLYIIVNYL